MSVSQKNQLRVSHRTKFYSNSGFKMFKMKAVRHLAIVNKEAVRHLQFLLRSLLGGFFGNLDSLIGSDVNGTPKGTSLGERTS